MEKLYWKVIHDCKFDIDDNYLEKILNSKGIEDVKSFLNVNESHTHSPFLFKNIKEGLELFHNALGGKIYIQVDSDTDGFTSASYIRNFIEKINNDTEIVYGLHYHKEHGLTCKNIEGIDNLDLIIVPDASIETAKEAQKIIETAKCPILILDHHKIEMEDHVTMINCMDGEYPNNTLSGVGVVHKFCLAYCEQYGFDKSICNEYLDLVALGMIGDSMDMRNLETRYYALEGLKEENRKNLLIKELADRFAEDMKLGHTIMSYGWVIAPKLNGCIRYGTEKEQLDLFRAICGEVEDVEYQPRRKKKTDPLPEKEIHSLQKTMARVSANAKARQDTAARKIMKDIDEIIIKNKATTDSVIIVDGTEVLSKKSLSGLVANKLTSKYQRPIIILKQTKDENILGGSGRGYEKGKITNFRDFLLSSELFEKCKGHENAFGIEISNKNIKKVVEFCNDKISKEDLVTIYEVDYEIKASVLKNTAIEEVASAYKIWGNKVNEPTFAITCIDIDAKDIQSYGENDGFIKFNYKGVDFIKKYCQKEDFKEMTLLERNMLGVNKKQLRLTVIGSFVYNMYEGKTYPQVKISKFYSEERPQEEDEISIDDIF